MTACPMTRRVAAFLTIRERKDDAVIRVYRDVGNVIETHEHAGEFKEW